MRNRSRFIPALALALTLLVTALLVTPAFAQDETPTEAPTETAGTETEPTPAEEIPPVEATAEIPAELAGTEEPPAEETPAEALAEEGLTLVDETGEPLVMAAEETAEALAAGEVWIKIGTVIQTFSSIQEAVDYIEINNVVPVDGTIHVDGTWTFTDQVVLIDGSTNASVNKIKALVGGTSTTTFQPTVTLDGISSITIQNMTYGTGFLLSGFNIQSDARNFGIQILDSSGPLRLIDLDVSGTDGIGIYVEHHNGSIEMDRVNVSDNAHQGAEIQNYDIDTDSYKTGAITIKNSSFDRNAGVNVYGSLSITTGGSVTLQGITVNDNEYGLHIIHSGKVTVKDSVFNNNTIVGTYAFWLEDTTGDPLFGDVLLDNVVVNDNDYGMSIHTIGNITANRLVVNDNAHIGAFFNTCGTAGCYNLPYGKVTVTNSNFDNNGGSEMLRIWSRGAVSLTNVSANGNTAGAGALVHTDNSLLVSPVTITGGTFNDNASFGLEVLSKGTITLSKVSASGNTGSFGATLDNSSGTTAGVTIKGTLVGDNAFDDNGGEGLFIRSNGAVTLGYLSASRNRGMGLNLEKTVGGVGALTITKGSFDDNGLQGILAISKGAIKLTTVSASGNMARGADLQNTISTAAPGVTITGGDFNHNQGTGLYVRSKGAITLKTTQAYDNSVHEMDFPTGVGSVHDVFAPSGSPDRWIINVDAGMLAIQYNGNFSSTGPCAWTLYDPTGTPLFSEECGFSGDAYSANEFPIVFDQTGEWVFELSTQSNGGLASYTFSSDVYGETTGDAWYEYDGADLDNTGGTTAGVTIANASLPLVYLEELRPARDFYANSRYGLLIRSNGAVSLSNVAATGNGSKGADIYNIPGGTSTAMPAVTINKGEFNMNGNTGLDITTRGVVTIKDLQVFSNEAIYGDTPDGYGARITNNGAAKAVSIINSASNAGYLQSNAMSGLVIRSHGAITLTNLSAGYNPGHGFDLDNTGGATGNLTLTNANFYGNAGDGLHALINGAITIKNVDAFANGGAGYYLRNDMMATGAPAVSITNTLVAGALFKGAGANTNGGLDLVSRGPVTLTNMLFYENTSFGAKIENNAYSSYDVKINNCQFGFRFGDNTGGGIGLQVTSMGSIILNKGSASGNELRGALLDNELDGSSPIKPVTITNFSFDDNGGTGLYVDSNGVVTLTNVGASGNTYYGAYIRSKTSNVFVKYSGSGSNTFSDNGYSGLDIRTSGTVSLAKVNAVGNTGGYGAQLGADLERVSSVMVAASKFDQNSMSGLLVYSLGTVSLNGVSAFDNASLGAYILNETATTATNVSISKSTFTENNASGLAVRSKGMVTLNGITNLDNGTGADINNTYGTAGVSVLSTLGANTFNGNSSRGLYIRSNGNVILSNVTANDNANNGIEIDNYQSGSGTGYVTLTKVTTWSNNYRGISIVTNNYVTIDGVSSVMNGTVGQAYAGVFVVTNNHNLTIKNSLISSNVAYGVYADLGSGLFSILNTFYFGNNTSDLGYPNIHLVP